MDTGTPVVHDAHRVSRRQLRYFLRHATSMARLFLSKPYWQTQRDSGAWAG